MFELYGIGAVALCMALVEMAKRLGLPARWAPVAAVLIGIGEGFVVFAHDPLQAVVLGIAAGLSAVGLFSGIKNLGGGGSQ